MATMTPQERRQPQLWRKEESMGKKSATNLESHSREILMRLTAHVGK
jgi:hypothetical protein